MRSLNRSTKISAALTLVAVAAVVALWFGNTESLDFPFEVITQDVQPGDMAEISTRTYVENAECRIAGTWAVGIPDDIKWSRIAVCATDNDCAEINLGQ